MRVSKVEKEKTFEKIVRDASRLFRADGFFRPSVADVMSRAGLTHGGFYRHFRNKDELISKSLDFAFSEVLKILDSTKGGKDSAKEFRSFYLSGEHRAHPERGCPLAAVGNEMRQLGPRGRSDVSLKMTEFIDRLSENFEGRPQEKKSQAIRELSMLVGALTLSRIATGELADEILRSCQKARLE